MTPFDALEGFERRAVRVRANQHQIHGANQHQGEASIAGAPDKGEDNPFTRAAAKFRDIEANKHRTKVLDINEVGRGGALHCWW